MESSRESTEEVQAKENVSSSSEAEGELVLSLPASQQVSSNGQSLHAEDISAKASKEVLQEGAHSEEAAAGRLRDYAARSWGTDPATGLRGQGKPFAPEFWSNFEQNPFVVEAAVGFAEVFPKFVLVPTLPAELRAKCLCAESVLAKEAAAVEDMRVAQSQGAARKASFEARYALLQEKMHSTIDWSEAASFLEEEAEVEAAARRDLERLRLRQQGNASLLVGISTDYLLSESQAGVGLGLRLGSHSLLSLPAMPPRRERQVMSNDSRVFVTASAASSSSPRDKEASIEDSFGDHFRSFLVDTSSLKAFRVETSSHVSEEIAAKVADARRMVDGAAGTVPALRECRRGRRELNRLGEQFLRRVVVTLQRCVRGFLGRRRFRRDWRKHNALRMVVRIQCAIRSMLARRLVKIKGNSDSDMSLPLP